MQAKLAIFLLFLWKFSSILSDCTKCNQDSKEDGLMLVHVLFRHGNRTPNGPDELYPNDPYLNFSYCPFGIGQLTNSGKKKEYMIGRDLRLRYDKFLDDNYYPNLVEAISTDYNRTKMSLELVLASLFIPKGVEVWNFMLKWQPVPYNYLPRPQDHILQGILCPYYVKLYNEHVQSPKVQSQIRTYQPTFDYISRKTGLNVTKFQDIYNLQFGLRAEQDYGLELHQWTKKVWPQPMIELSAKEYSVATGTTQLRQMASGFLLEKMLRDTDAKINGTLPGRKLVLYSAHEDNIANFLITLGVFGKPHIPNYGSYVVVEVHRNKGQYGIKIIYQNYEESKPKVLKLPACEELCPLEQFKSLTEEYIPTPNMCNQ